MSSYAYLKQWASTTPNALAVVHDERHATFRNVLGLVDAAVEVLKSRGVAAGSRVAIQNQVSQLTRQVLYFALDKIGAVSGLVPDNAHPLFDLVVAERGEDDARTLIVNGRRLQQTMDGAMPGQAEPAYEWRDDEPCRIYASSGSTGDAKIIQRSYGLHRRNLDNYHLCHPLVPGDVAVNTIGLATPGTLLLTTAWMRGAAITFARSGEPELFDILERRGVTAIAVSPVTLQKALRGKLPAKPLTRLGIYVYGGRASPELLTTLREHVTRRIALNYGTSEAGLAILSWVRKRIPDHTLGLPLPSVRLDIVDADGRSVPDGTPGLIRHRCVFADCDGYLDSSGTLSPFKTYLSSDQGFRDEAGRIHVMGRTDDVLNLGGVKVPLAHVETIVNRTAMCEEFVVFRQADAEHDAAAWVAAKMREGHAPERLQQILREALPKADLKVLPVLHGLPRLMNEKFDIQALRRIAADRTPRRNTEVQ